MIPTDSGKKNSLTYKISSLMSSSIRRRFGRILLLGFFVIAGSMGFDSPASGWERNTHRELTEEAIKINEGVLNSYLEANLGLENGLNEFVDKKTVKQWLMEGSDLEDGEEINLSSFTSTITTALSKARPFNHFHEPVSNSGLPGKDSAIFWSLAPLGSQSPGGPYSWNDARDNYFKALTSETKDERDEYWGKTFRALGQVMHLLQDSANPSHVRNDLHPFDEGLHDFMANRSVVTYTGGGTFSPDLSILEQSGPAGPNGEPFANLFDRDTYQGSAPEATLGTDIGVTEYTHANFFSDDTIPFQVLGIPSHNFPSLSELIPATGPFPSDQSYLTLLRLGSPADPNARAAKFTGNQALAKFSLSNLPPLELIGKLELDDAVYDAQARHLIPRAVGYSAAVLEYFFRLQFPLEPSFNKFEVLGDPPTFPPCGPPPDPRQDGSLGVAIPIPSDLNFIGTASLYYEKPDGSRVLEEQLNFPRPFPPFDELGFGVRIPLAGLVQDQPIRWYVVLKGNAGPGVQEEQAILAKTDEAEWVYECTN